MAVNTLKAALRDCLINFDQRVLVTDLLYEYGLSYGDAEQTLAQYIAQQEEQGAKYEKRFMVHGKETNSDNEVYTVVDGDAKLSEWLVKLRNAESSLYSVEVAGGAKAMPPVFKPMLRSAVRLKNVKLRADAPKATNGIPNGTSNGSGPAETVKLEPKAAEVKKKPKGIEGFAKKTNEESAGSSSQVTANAQPQSKKSPTEAKKSPPEKKKSAQKTTNKKGIGNFFAPTAAGTSSGGTKKEATGVIKQPTPKKVNDFFKKQENKPTNPISKAKGVTKQEPNVSIQLFDDDDDDHESEAQSSDEEEKLSALKRDIITSDHEHSDEADNQPGGSAKSTRQKRRRIEDSDDEDEAPQQKHEKTDQTPQAATVDKVDDEKSPPPSETYFDEESGFVITVKSKKSHVPSPKRTAKISPPPIAAKATANHSKKATAASTPAANAGKTKQANIMNFFGKK